MTRETPAKTFSAQPSNAKDGPLQDSFLNTDY